MITHKNTTELRELIKNARLSREITHAIVHCSATKETASVNSIISYWKNVNLWKNVGYHVIVSLDNYTILEDFNKPTNGAKGYNANSVHICYIGGVDEKNKPKDTLTDYQESVIRAFLEEFKKRLNDIKIIGHNEVSNKACPSFNVKNKFPDL